MTPTTVALLALELALVLSAGLAAGRTRARIALASLLALVALAIPLAIPPELPALRALMALASIFPVLRTIEVAADRRTHPTWLRVFAFVAPLDAFAARRVAPSLDLRGLAEGAAWAAIAIAASLSISHAPITTLRALTMAVVLYTAMEAGSVIDRALLRAVGVETPLVQDAPIRSRSVAELWSRRWNRAVGGWLRKHTFAPLARHGHTGLALVASFAASAALHFWPIFVALGLSPAIAMAAFFLVQLLLIAIEARLGVARWPAPVAHAWTITVMLAASPLFTVPVLMLFGLA
jgi:hypothetical protein